MVYGRPLLEMYWKCIILYPFCISNLWFISQVTYRADSLVLDFLKLAQDGNPLFSVIGELEWKCQDIGPGNPLAFKDNGEKNYMVSKQKKYLCWLFLDIFWGYTGAHSRKISKGWELKVRFQTWQMTFVASPGRIGRVGVVRKNLPCEFSVLK